jgi:hypothetical protein
LPAPRLDLYGGTRASGAVLRSSSTAPAAGLPSITPESL